jgi:hypothetical protein
MNGARPWPFGVLVVTEKEHRWNVGAPTVRHELENSRDLFARHVELFDPDDLAAPSSELECCYQCRQRGTPDVDHLLRDPRIRTVQRILRAWGRELGVPGHRCATSRRQKQQA